jgi:glutamate dehydrogenase
MAWQQGKERLLEQVQERIVAELPKDEAMALSAFLHQFYDRFPIEDLGDRRVEDLYGAVYGSWKFIQQCQPNKPKIRLFNPNYEQHGWQLQHTVVAIASRNMPFLTDSVRGELNRRNIVIHSIYSCIYHCVRDQGHQLVHLLDEKPEQTQSQGGYQSEEVFLYLEMGRNTDEAELQEIGEVLGDILSEVAMVVDDHHAMIEQAKLTMVGLTSSSLVNKQAADENKLFMDWLVKDHFTFLGYEKITLVDNGDVREVERVEGSSLGLLKLRESNGVNQLQGEINRAEKPEQLLADQIVCSKSSRRSRVHRFVYPDVVSVKCFDSEGNVVSQHRFLGLYTSRVYTLSPKLIPVVRNKIARVYVLSKLHSRSHSGRNLERLLEMFPREELFQSSVDELFKLTMDVHGIRERRQVRLFARKGFYGRFVNCLLYIPRDIYQTSLRVKIETLLCDAFGASESEFSTFFSESILVRIHFVLRVDSDDLRDVDIKALEEEIIQVTMSWQDYLKTHLIEEFGEERGADLSREYDNAFPPGYMDDFDPHMAITDIKKIASLSNATDIKMSFYRVHGEQENEARFRLFHLDSPLILSDVMPILEHMGLKVISERPYGLKFNNGKQAWIHEFSLIYGVSEQFDISKVGENFQQAFYHIWYGHAESDAFNKLILGAQIGW